MLTPEYVLTWDDVGSRYYELGVSNGVLYPQKADGTYDAGVAWNGLTSVSESPSGADATDLWADNIKYAVLRSVETFGGTIEAYTYPPEFEECDGSADIATGVKIGQQPRKAFGLSYKTKVGNDTTTETDDGYKLHIVYGCTASPSERQYSTINDSPDAIQFSWEFQTTPVTVASHKETATITIDSRTADATKLAALEQILYGTPASGNTPAVAPRLPLPAEIITTMT